jgi:hypothetical protein
MVLPSRALGLCAPVFLALSLLSGTAWAGDDDTGDASDAPSAVPLHIRSLPEGEVAEVERVVGRRKPGEVVVQCPEDCDRMLAPGKYQVRLYDASGHDVGSTRLSLSWPTTLSASAPGSRSLGKWGLGMGIMGSVGTVVGAALLLFSVLGEMDDPRSASPSQQESLQQYRTAAAVVTLTSLGLALSGWVLFGSNHLAFQTSTDYPWRRGVSFGVAPADHGLMTGMTLLF